MEHDGRDAGRPQRIRSAPAPAVAAAALLMATEGCGRRTFAVTPASAACGPAGKYIIIGWAVCLTNLKELGLVRLCFVLA